MTFLFDIGNVLVDFDMGTFEKKIQEKSELTLGKIHAVMEPLRVVYEYGRMSDEEFVRTVVQETRFIGTREEVILAWNSIFTPRTEIWRIVARLHDRGYRMYLLSNTNGLHLRYLRERFEVFTAFEDGVYSHLTGSMKPEDLIFEEVKRRLPLIPEETLYIDDIAANCEAGRRHGFRAFGLSADGAAEFEYMLRSDWLL